MVLLRDRRAPGHWKMPSATQPPEEKEICIYVQPYIRKYLLARLADPVRRLTDGHSRALFDTLEQRLGGRKLIAVVNDYDVRKDEPTTRVRLRVQLKPQQKDLNATHHAHLTGILTRSYQQEMYEWVDWYRTRLGMSTRRALKQFLRHYSISEEDYAFLSAERMYHKHCQRTGQSRPRKQSVRNRRGAAGEPSRRWPHRA